ncbi:hypothetical protein D3C78_1373650 [compost metagenome]
MVVLRGITFSISPPMVSRPRDSGITSRSSNSPPSRRLPARVSAWIAAPMATTWSGSISVSGVRPNSAPTASRTRGTRVEPPTITTAATSSSSTPLSRTARRQALRLRATIGSIRASKAPRVSSACQLPWATVTESASVRASLAAQAVCSNWRWAPGSRSEDRPACSTIQLAIAWSKSSPPRALSPPVASTSKTPPVRRRIEISKVPPPRS